MSAWLAARSERERVVLVVGGCVVLALLLWFAIVEPLAAARAAARADLPRLRAQAQSVEAGAAELRALRERTAGRGASTEPLAAILAAAEALGLKDRVRNLAPMGDTIVVTLDAVPHRDLVRWLAALARDHGITVAAMNARAGDAGQGLRVEGLTLAVGGGTR